MSGQKEQTKKKRSFSGSQFPEGAYDPLKTEAEILKFWRKGRYNKPEYNPEMQGKNGKRGGLQTTSEMKKDSREPFCIVMPPPNANDRPHLGNISGYSYQDLLGRYQRLIGKKVLLLPGKDHAGIQTEAVFERTVLRDKGLSKSDIGRDEFYKRCYEYCKDCARQARQDEERVGISADFERDVFTLDPAIVDIIIDTFIRLYRDKLVYKGIRITNWCPQCQTALSDADTERKDRDSQLTYIKYPAKDGEGFITIATTRPETMLADTAVAVNPNDKRYKFLVGKTVVVPLVDREVPVITDVKVDMDFGTGALKVTPSHAPEDYEIMLGWNADNPDKQISYINVVGKDLKLHGPVGRYAGMKFNKARAEVLEDLNKLGLIEKTEIITQNVAICERCKSIIEPIMSSQWYVKVDGLRKEAIKAVKSGKIKIYPKYMEKAYFNWMENLRDWPISRSLWWGYRFPVWYKGKKEEHIDAYGKIVETIGGKLLDPSDPDQLKVQHESPGKGWYQDEDVFDTWFSSGQWPFVTLMKEGLIDTFYPTQVMETGYDILALWVSRMIMLGIYRTREIPFENVYLHGILRAQDGQKMSKSKGNIVSMDDIVNEHGADTLRLFYYVAGKAGGSYNFDWERIKFNRKFLNKIWNAARFFSRPGLEEVPWIFEEIERVSKRIAKHIESFKFNLAAEEIYESFWHVFCDKYIEEVKALADKDSEDLDEGSKKDRGKPFNPNAVALKAYLVMLHPFVPFITEALWQIFRNNDDPETIMYAKWPSKLKA